MAPNPTDSYLSTATAQNNSSKQKQNNESIVSRNKQQVMSLVVSLLTSIDVASIFGGVSASQISNIKSGVNNLASRQTLIVHQLEQLEQTTQKQHFESHGVLIYMIMVAEYDHIENELDQFVSI